MWISSKLGFFSIVRYVPRKGEKVARSRQYMVRARNSTDLDNLMVATGIKKTKIKTPYNDYAERLFVSEDEKDKIVLACARIDYTNFKGMIHATPNQEDKLDAYLTCWEAMVKYQRKHEKPFLWTETCAHLE